MLHLEEPAVRERPRRRVNVHITRHQHKSIVAGGIIVCGVVAVWLPDHVHVNVVGGTIINLFWLLVEPSA